MSDDSNSTEAKQSNNNKSLVDQVLAELVKQKREGAKGKIKSLLIDLQKNDDIRKGIVDKIEEALSEVGESVDLKSLLS
jgi:hypothetical protein